MAAYIASQRTYTGREERWIISPIGRFLTLTMENSTQWHYKNKPVQELPEEYVGFVYMITNTVTGKMYIGKKLSKFKTTRYKMHTQKNGKKVRKKIRGAVASDWKDYYGSSDALNQDVEKLGKDRFRRDILLSLIHI